MKNKLLALGVILLIVVNISALLTFAYHRWVSPTPPAGIEKSLSLNRNQEECIKGIRCSLDEEIKVIHYQMQENKRALVDQIKKDAPDMAAINKLIEEISGLQAEIQKRAVLNLFKEKQVLTPEQREKFCRMFENHVCPKGKKGHLDSPGGGGASRPLENGTGSITSH